MNISRQSSFGLSSKDPTIEVSNVTLIDGIYSLSDSKLKSCQAAEYSPEESHATNVRLLISWSSSEGGNEHQLHEFLIPGYMWQKYSFHIYWTY